MAKTRIIILGGGFAGVKCARKLRKLLKSEQYEIVLFNRENHMVFHPLLAEVASAAAQPKDVAAPLRQLLHGVSCRTEDVLSIDLDKSFIDYESHDGSRRQMQYDQLVIACGNTVNLGLIHGMDDHAFPLKTVGDALALQSHVMEQMEKAEVCDDPVMKKWYLSVIVVGGGFSGIEVAGEINNLVRRSRKFFSNINADDICVTVIHSRDQILPEVYPSLRDFAHKRMEQAGVRILLNQCAEHATPSGVTLKDGTLLSGGTIVCTIGTTTLPLIKRLTVEKKNNRIATASDMSLPQYPNVWAIGDCAAIINALDGSLSPTVAQFAERQGTQAAENIAARLEARPTKPFHYKMMGQLCSIGGHDAVAEIMGMRLSGFIAWVMWRGIYLMKLPSVSQQARVGLEWCLDLVFPRTLAHIKADRTKRVGRAYYAAGDVVIRQGDMAIDFYVIEEGEAEVVKKREDGNGEETIAILGRGDFFGEGALISSRPRAATVRARTDVEVVVLGRGIFTQISTALAPLRDAVAKAAQKRTNIWSTLTDIRAVLDTIALRELLEPLTAEETLHPDSSVSEAISRINKERLEFCCVVDEKHSLLGIVTRTDLLRAIEVAAALPEDAQFQMTVKDIMVKDPIAVTVDESTALAVLTMREHGFKLLLVIEDQETRCVKGYIRIENIMDNIISRLVVYDRKKPVTESKATQEFTMVQLPEEKELEIQKT
jgi:NADH dehydrogenase